MEFGKIGIKMDVKQPTKFLEARNFVFQEPLGMI